MNKKITFNISGIGEGDKIASSVNTMLDNYDALSFKRTNLGIVFGDNNTDITLHNGKQAKLGNNGYFYNIARFKDTGEFYNLAYVNYSGGNKMFAITNLAIALGDLLSHEHFEKWYEYIYNNEDEKTASKLDYLVALRGAYGYALAIVLLNNTSKNKAMTLLQRVDISSHFPFIDLPFMLTQLDRRELQQNILDLAIADRLFGAHVMINWDLGTLMNENGEPYTLKDDEDKYGKVPYYDNTLLYMQAMCEFIEKTIECAVKNHNLDGLTIEDMLKAVDAVKSEIDMLNMLGDAFIEFMESEEGQKAIAESNS